MIAYEKLCEALALYRQRRQTAALVGSEAEEGRGRETPAHPFPVMSEDGPGEITVDPNDIVDN